MAENVLGALFGNIADAIREKTGDTATMKPADFPEQIKNIEVSNVIENVEVVVDFSNGDMTQSLPEGDSARSVTIKKPDNLIPENIAKDVDIAGIIGTHEGGGSTEKIIFPLQNVSGFALNENYGFYTKDENPSPFVLESGKTYIVEWDGTTYECTAEAINESSTGIGNHLIMDGTDTGEPFGIGSLNNGEGLTYFASDTKTEHEIKISEKVSGGDGGEKNIVYATGTLTWNGNGMWVQHGLGVVPDLVVIASEMEGVSGKAITTETGISTKFKEKSGSPHGVRGYQYDGSVFTTIYAIDQTNSMASYTTTIHRADSTQFLISGGSVQSFVTGNTLTWEAYGNLV